MVQTTGNLLRRKGTWSITKPNQYNVRFFIFHIMSQHNIVLGLYRFGLGRNFSLLDFYGNLDMDKAWTYDCWDWKKFQCAQMWKFPWKPWRYLEVQNKLKCNWTKKLHPQWIFKRILLFSNSSFIFRFSNSIF